MTASDSTVSTGGDFDVGERFCARGYVDFTNVCLSVNHDFIIGQAGGGDGTAEISGGNSVVSALAIADRSCAGGSGYITINCGAQFLVDGAGGNRCTRIGWAGTCNSAQLHVDGACTVVTINDPVNITMSNQGVIELGCDGTITGSSLIEFTTCAIIRGDGVLNLAIELGGGVFGTGDVASDVLVLGGLITQDSASDDFTINGSGTIQLGASDRIADAVDMVLGGGTFDLNGFSETIDNLSLSSTSTIAFKSGDSSQDFLFDDLNLNGNTLTITGWDGVAGAAGTGATFVSTSSYSIADLANVYFDGFGFGGIQLAGGEIVPNGAIPEPSTWFGGFSLLSLALWHCWRRRMRMRIRGP